MYVESAHSRCVFSERYCVSKAYGKLTVSITLKSFPGLSVRETHFCVHIIIFYFCKEIDSNHWYKICLPYTGNYDWHLIQDVKFGLP